MMDIITVILLIIIVLQTILHHFERKDLYNRIMCNSLAEYKSKESKYVQSAHDRVIKRWRRKDGDK